MQLTYSLNKEQYLEFLLACFVDENATKKSIRLWRVVLLIFFAVTLFLYYKAFGTSFGFFICAAAFAFVWLTLGKNIKNSQKNSYLAYIDRYMSAKVDTEHTAILGEDSVKMIGEFDSYEMKFSGINRIKRLQSVFVVMNKAHLNFIFPLTQDGEKFVQEIANKAGLKIEIYADAKFNQHANDQAKEIR